MEKNFYQDNFEQLLKEASDNFRMYPSKRVWHGIYNDLHPGRKWPSLAIWLLLISSGIFVGLSNRNQAHFNVPAGNLIAVTKTTGSASTAINTTTRNKVKATRVKKQEILHNFNGENSAINIDTRSNPLNDNSTDQNIQSANIIAFYKNILDDKKSSAATDGDQLMAEAISKTGITGNGKKQSATGEDALAELNKLKASTGDNLTASKDAKDKTKKDLVKTNINTSNTDKEWIEDYAFHNKPSGSKWKSRVTYELYTTPSIGYRTIRKNTSFNPVIISPLLATTGIEQDYDNAVSQASAVNMELGGNILYSISKKLNLKIGVQVNYTNYNINVYELKHPTLTTIILNDLNTGLPVLSSRATTLANTEGVYNKKLNNNTYQISLPVGADIKLAGNNNLKWFAGATIQPTYIAGGNAYFISSDLKNYVTDNSLLRKWNLNAGIETFISYKTKSGIIVNAGPQFRYQLLSTYSKEYSYDEKLYNVGLKIGIITRF